MILLNFTIYCRSVRQLFSGDTMTFWHSKKCWWCASLTDSYPDSLQRRWWEVFPFKFSNFIYLSETQKKLYSKVTGQHPPPPQPQPHPIPHTPSFFNADVHGNFLWTCQKTYQIFGGGWIWWKNCKENDWFAARNICDDKVFVNLAKISRMRVKVGYSMKFH